MKRKLMAILLSLAVCFCLVLASCDSGKDKDKDDESENTEATIASTGDSGVADSSDDTTESSDDVPEDEVCNGHGGGTATCIQKAICAFCGEEYGDFGDHAEQPILGENATCLEIGWTNGIGCAICGETLVAREVIDALGHDYGEDDVCDRCGFARVSIGLEFELSEDETYYIVIGIGTCTDDNIIIPSTHDGKPVKEIGEDAFAYERYISSVAIPSSITVINSSAFAYTVLRNITVDKDNTAYVSIDSDLYTKDGKTLVKYATGKEATTFVIPDSVIVIGDYAVSNSGILVSVEIGNNVTTIGNYAFDTCYTLTSVEMGEGVITIGTSAFERCSITSIVIPDSTTTVGDYAFSQCSYLTSVEIGNRVNYIGDDAFFSCNIISIEIPDSVTYIGADAFSLCFDLKSVVIPDSVITMGDRAFYRCEGLETVVIGNSVTSIGVYAFRQCYSLVSVKIGDSVASIGDSAFRDCKALTSTEIPDSVTTIDECAFYECEALTSVKIGNGVTTIGEQAFAGCYSMTSVVIGENVTSIDESSFYGCLKLVEVYNLSELDIAKGSEDNGWIGYYALDIYSSLEEESKQFITEDGFIFYVDGETRYLLGYTGDETSITLPANCNGKNYAIYNYAFIYCTSLTSVVIPDSVTSIGYCAFAECTSLTIYCEASKEPSGWDSDWNSSNCPVVWGYKQEN